MPAMLFGILQQPYRRSPSLHLFSAPAATLRLFWSKNRLFSAFVADLCGMCKISLGESHFPPKHNLIAIRQLQTA